MASTDSLSDVTAFAEKNNANFPILADPDKNAAKNYGVLSVMGFAKRWTFYIDKQGVVRKIDKAVQTTEHGESVARTLQELGVPKKNPASSSN